ncbi:MAG: DUF951 domain-containing protein [Chloroflexota bacterium]
MAPIGRGRQIVLPDLEMDEVLRLRKPHPCGSRDWVVVRLGADIGLKCLGCGRRIMLSRREVSRRLKTRLSKASSPADG